MDISVVIPVYGCREALPALHHRLTRSLKQITEDYEIIFVNDCDPQNSWEEIVKICSNDQKVVGLNMSRNFGQIKAITAGLDYCSGEYVVVMDCDLQDRPEGILELYSKIQEGYDIVFAKRLNRQDNWFVKTCSKLFYKIYNYFSDGMYDSSICNFNISRKKVIDYYCQMREYNRGFTIFLKWLGFNSTSIDIQHDKRAAGKSSYSIRKKMRMATSFITAQSNKPLRLSIYIGLLAVIFSIVIILISLINYFSNGYVPAGWTSMIVSIYLMGGLILMVLGVLGIYIGNIFDESKNRPLYVIKDEINVIKKGE